MHMGLPPHAVMRRWEMVRRLQRLSSWAKSLSGSWLFVGIAARIRSATVCLKVAMASAVFLGTRTHSFGTGTKACPTEIADRSTSERDAKLLHEPDPYLFIRGKPFGVVQPLFQCVSSPGSGWSPTGIVPVLHPTGTMVVSLGRRTGFKPVSTTGTMVVLRRFLMGVAPLLVTPLVPHPPGSGVSALQCSPR
jgi:hypothetical protein